MSDEYGVIDFASRVLETGFEIVGFKIWKLFENLLRCETSSKEIEHIRNANAKSTDAGATAALGGIRGDPRKQVCHIFTLARSGVFFLHGNRTFAPTRQEATNYLSLGDEGGEAKEVARM
jgi:hypothetical protein